MSYQTRSVVGKLFGFFVAFMAAGAAVGVSSAPALASTLTVAQVANLPKAENAIQTSNGRNFVSTDGKLFELRESSNGNWSASAVPTRYTRSGQSACYFTGLAEYAATLYALCADNTLLASAPKHLLALDLNQASPTLQEIAVLHDFGFPNGLAADGAGHLYYANTALLLPGSVWRITLASRFAVAEEKEFYSFPLCVGNGLKFFRNQLYVGVNPPTFVGLSQLLRYDVNASGLANKTVIYQSLGIIDDFELVQGGVVLAEYLGSRIVHLSESGQVLHTASFSAPTSVHLISDPVRGQRELLVTEAGANRASLVQTDWNLAPRQ